MRTKTRKYRKSELTAESARSFSRISPQNAAWVMAHLKCECSPYRDVFTYNRWRAQGYQVRRGEHGIKLSVILEAPEEKRDGTTTTRKVFTSTTVFCRCQVDAIEAARSAPVAPKPEAQPAVTIAVEQYLKAQPVAQVEIPQSPALGGELTRTPVDRQCSYTHTKLDKYEHSQAQCYHYQGVQSGMTYDFMACETCAAAILKGGPIPTTPAYRGIDHAWEETITKARERVANGEADMTNWIDRNIVKWSDYEPTMTVSYDGNQILHVNGNYKAGMVKTAIKTQLAML